MRSNPVIARWLCSYGQSVVLTQQRLRLLCSGAVRHGRVHVHVQRSLAELRVEEHDEQTQDGVAAHEEAHEIGQRALHAEVHEAHDEDEGRAAAVREQEAELLADPRLHVLEAALEREQQQREDAAWHLSYPPVISVSISYETHIKKSNKNKKKITARSHGVDRDEEARDVQHHEVEEPQEARERLQHRQHHVGVAQVAHERGGLHHLHPAQRSDHIATGCLVIIYL
ncbi:unnamed protein product [Phytophthora fragariaefolia]|uniref:Unnamed protein product n=1 Tax=Phytophthora fragariaefolia TaxID=1490495 RepID=A0A9W6U1Q3_9STRA|nr:unnamed protein product [Phytophthora fragariaefolia]